MTKSNEKTKAQLRKELDRLRRKFNRLEAGNAARPPAGEPDPGSELKHRLMLESLAEGIILAYLERNSGSQREPRVLETFLRRRSNPEL